MSATNRPHEVAASIIVYCLCSGSMLLLNKVAIYQLGGAPGLVSFIQVTFTALLLLGLRRSGKIQVDSFEWSKIKPYLYYVLGFVVALMCNMRALHASNVDTVIVFRSCTPLAVAVLDWAFLGRELPSARSAATLVLMLVGAAGYVSKDASFALNGLGAYGWVSAYFVAICFEMTYGKAILSSVRMQSVGGSVMYTNVLSALPMLAITVGSGEAATAVGLNWGTKTLALLLLSCIVGTCISYAGWWCRGLVSATSYTVIGVANKMLTIMLNVLVWDKHASPAGLAYLLVCLCGGALYKQAPMRSTKDAESLSPTPRAGETGFSKGSGGGKGRVVKSGSGLGSETGTAASSPVSGTVSSGGGGASSDEKFPLLGTGCGADVEAAHTAHMRSGSLNSPARR